MRAGRSRFDGYSNFEMTKFSFINTSGGSTDATSAKIRADNLMTWAGVSQVTGKPILADTGYGVNGASAGHDANWDVAANINARIADGVVAVTQYNPNSSSGTTIANVRSQLSTPRFCPRPTMRSSAINAARRTELSRCSSPARQKVRSSRGPTAAAWILPQRTQHA
jgi:hypothetical protein